jgi:inhibitor of KinA
MNFTPLGDSAVTVTFGAAIDETAHRRLHGAVQRIRDANLAGVIDLIPAFTSFAVHYDPVQIEGPNGAATDSISPYENLIKQLRTLLQDLGDEPMFAGRTVEIPVCYGGDLGPDLDDVARQHALTADDVIARHAAGNYLVYMVGFMPGFAYLGGLDSRLATPRRKSPRTVVPARTVGIGGTQTGVYPLESPGGWNLIGRTPLAIFDVGREEPTLLAAGDRVRFRPISRDEYRDWPA